MKKLLALALALCLVLSLCACGGAAASAEAASTASAAEAAPAADSGETYNISIQFSFPEESAAGALKVLDAIEQESGGRIKFEKYYSFGMVDAADVITALQTNQLDICAFMPFEHPAEMPLSGSLVTLPLLNYPNWEASTQIYLQTMYGSEDMMKEYTDNGMVLWSAYMVPGYNFYSTKEITDFTPATFAGLTVMCDQPQMATFVSSNNGGAISAFPPDYLSNLQNGVADALVQHVNCAYVFGTLDYVKSAIMFGEGGFYNVPQTFCFSQLFWDKLPEDLQKLFTAHASDLAYEMQASDGGLNQLAMATLEEKATVTVLDDAQIAEWQDAIAPIVEQALTDITAQSPNAMSVYETLKNNIANYNADTIDLGTNNFGDKVEWKSTLPAE